MVEISNLYKDSEDPITIRALNQMARELLLLQSSDWLFIITNGTMVEYAHKRIKEHTGRFNALYDMVKNNRKQILTDNSCAFDILEEAYSKYVQKN